MYLRDFLALKPFHDCSLCSVCILPQPVFYSQSAVCILHTVFILPLVRSLQSESAVRSLPLTLTGYQMRLLVWRVVNRTLKFRLTFLILNSAECLHYYGLLCLLIRSLKILRSSTYSFGVLCSPLWLMFVLSNIGNY